MFVHAGGSSAFLELATAFHRRCLEDPVLAAEVGRHNRRVVEEHHDLDQQVQRLEEAFRYAEALPMRERRRGGRPR